MGILGVILVIWVSAGFASIIHAFSVREKMVAYFRKVTSTPPEDHELGIFFYSVCFGIFLTGPIGLWFVKTRFSSSSSNRP